VAEQGQCIHATLLEYGLRQYESYMNIYVPDFDRIGVVNCVGVMLCRQFPSRYQNQAACGRRIENQTSAIKEDTEVGILPPTRNTAQHEYQDAQSSTPIDSVLLRHSEAPDVETR